MNESPPLAVPGPRLGVDLGGTSLTAVVTGEGATVLAVIECPTGDHSNPDAVLDRIAAISREAVAKAGLRLDQLVAAGAGLPGEVEPARGLFRASPILPSWRNVLVADQLSARLGVPVAVDNDANAALIGEYAFGAARGANPVLLLTLGTGIGGAVLVNGRVLSGFQRSAGEVGHIPLDPNGPLCWCGQRGCLGMLASTTALLNRYRANAGLPLTATMDGKMLAAACAAGDAAALQALDETARYLALGISSAAVVLAPQRVVLFGGILGGLAEALIARVRQRLRAQAYPAVIAALELAPAMLGTLAGAIGASLLPWQDDSIRDGEFR